VARRVDMSCASKYLVSVGMTPAEKGRLSMKQYLPGRVELAMFGVLSSICAVVVYASGQHDAGLALLAFPLFIFSAILGLRRSWRERASDE
jgi:hypothetical protein